MAELEVRAVAKYIRMSPFKVRLVANMVKGKQVDDALAQLKFLNKAAADPVAKAIKIDEGDGAPRIGRDAQSCGSDAEEHGPDRPKSPVGGQCGGYDQAGPEAVLFAGIGSCLIYAAQIIKQICSSASFRVGFKNAMKRP